MLNKERYKLNISDDNIVLFNQFIWYWNPINSDIWFIWNEEKFEENQSVSERINLINDNSKICMFCDRNNWYFSKLFTDYQDYENLWYWYQYIRDNYNEDLNKFFISEFFFLPSEKWTKLWETYWLNNSNWDFNKNRNDFYKSNPNLSDFLIKRLEYLLWVLYKNKNKTVYIYWKDENIDDKIELLQKTKYKDLLENLQAPLKYDNEWNRIKIKKILLGSNTIYISQNINKL